MADWVVTQDAFDQSGNYLKLNERTRALIISRFLGKAWRQMVTSVDMTSKAPPST